jgi:hypothetical protein
MILLIRFGQDMHEIYNPLASMCYCAYSVGSYSQCLRDGVSRQTASTYQSTAHVHIFTCIIIKSNFSVCAHRGRGRRGKRLSYYVAQIFFIVVLRHHHVIGSI